MGWEKLADLGAGIWKRFFSKEVAEKNKRKERKKLARELNALWEKSPTTRNRMRMDAIYKRLREIQDDFAS